MIEYTTVLILIFLTYLTAVINIKIPIVGALMCIIDALIMIPDPLTTGRVIIGYNVIGTVASPIIVSFSWLTIVIVIGIFINVGTVIIKYEGGF